jgi:hypothetical protein
MGSAIDRGALQLWFALTLLAACHRLGQFLSQLTKMAEEFNTAV